MTERAFILAGGAGSRLWPLTDESVRPKPNVYMGGSKRMLEYVADGFVRADYSHLYIAVQHMREGIKHAFGDGSDFVYGPIEERVPLRITYTEAPPGKPFRGTADALRKSRVYLADKVVVTDRENHEESEVSGTDYLSSKAKLKFKRFVDLFDTIIIGSGDGINNFDVADLVRFHKDRGGIATIAAYKMDNTGNIVGNFGTITIGDHGKIEGFDEKPDSLEAVKSDVINTGIYVFDASILDWLDKHSDVTDFGNHVFPELLRQGEKVFAHTMSGYWNDIGTLESYRRTNLELIDGIYGIDIRSHIKRQQEANRILGQPSHYLISQGCEIERDTTVKNSVLGNDVTIKRGAILENSVVLSGVTIGEGVNCQDSIIDSDVQIDKGAQIGRFVVIGKGTHVRSNAIIHPGVKIRPGEIVEGEVKHDLLTEK
ncbi:MAG TPA: NDP-sugar synthase [archaeon]|nr:NDP-sugar synthase [archaeon]